MVLSGYEIAEILCQAGTAVAATLDREVAIERILEQLAQVVPYDSASVQLLREGYLEIVGGRGWSDPESVVGLRFPVPGDNPNTIVIQERRPHILDDAPGPYTTFVGTSSHIRSWLGVPLIIHDRVIGMLTVDSTQPDYFTSDHARLVTALASQVSVAIENSRLYAQVQQRVAELEAVRRTSLKLSSSLDLPDVLDSVAESALDLVGATDCIIYLYDQESDSFSFGTARGGWLEKDRVTLPRRGGMTSAVVQQGQPVVIDDAARHPLFSTPEAKEWNVQATAAFPLRRAGRVLGVLHVIFVSQPHTFREEELRVLSLLADQAAIAIENARLFDQAQQEIAERTRAEEELRQHRDHLEELIGERTADLMEANAQLQQEVAERTRVEAELRASQEYARNLIDSSLDAIIAVDSDRRIVEFNKAAQDTFGYRPQEILGQHIDVLYAEPGEGIDIHQTTIEQGHCMREVRNRRKNGEVFPVFLSASPLLDARGELVGVMGVSRDITERVQAEAELRVYQEQLKELVEERTAKLRESERRYRTLFDGIPVALYRTTPAGQIVDANLALVHMLGYPTREHYLASSLASVYLAPEDRMRWQALMEREGVVRDFEVRLRRYDGAVIWVSDTARAVRDEEGQVQYYEGSLEDITERVQAEAELWVYQEHLEELVEERTAELRASEERYRTLFDGVPVGLYRTTPAGQFVDVNLAMAQMLGFSTREDLLAVSPTASLYVDPEERGRWKDLMEREGVVLDFEIQGRRPDGTLAWYSDTARAVRDERGEVLYYEGSLEDITGRKKLEEEIRLQKDYYEALFVNSPVAVVTADLDGNIVSWNPMAETLFGYTQEEVFGKNIDDLVANQPQLRDEAFKYTRQAIEVGRVQATTKRTRKDGSLVDVEVLALPVVVAGETVGFIAIYHDIGPLQEARRAAEAANQAKSAFLANMSHELRTPLNAILGFTQLMGRDPTLSAEQGENLEIINHSGEHLLALINDVLDMSKIEAGQLTLQETNFDLYRLLDGLEEMFRLRAGEKGLALRFERAESVPQYVRADESKLRQVLSNLLGNAVKFTQEGGVTFRVRSREYVVGSRKYELESRQLPSPTTPSPLLPTSYSLLHFEVEDTGPGIAPEDMAAVFDPFVQAASRRQSQEGTGLGLAISRQYVRLMGGDLSVSSEIQRGCLFKFDVQVMLTDAAEVGAARPAQRVLGLAPDQPIYRLLVAEDDETNRHLLVRLLEPLGFDVKEAVDGQEATEIWNRWEPHLIWMDMRMPVMDGYEATRAIRSELQNCNTGIQTVIIALTASAFEEDRERVLVEGCDDFVRKPFREDEICEMLAKHLGVRFLYEEIGGGDRDREQIADDVLARDMAALPGDWVADLKEATIRADLSRIITLVDLMREDSPALADALIDMAHNFEYKRILTLIEQGG